MTNQPKRRGFRGLNQGFVLKYDIISNENLILFQILRARNIRKANDGFIHFDEKCSFDKMGGKRLMLSMKCKRGTGSKSNTEPPKANGGFYAGLNQVIEPNNGYTCIDKGTKYRARTKWKDCVVL